MLAWLNSDFCWLKALTIMFALLMPCLEQLARWPHDLLILLAGNCFSFVSVQFTWLSKVLRTAGRPALCSSRYILLLGWYTSKGLLGFWGWDNFGSWMDVRHLCSTDFTDTQMGIFPNQIFILNSKKKSSIEEGHRISFTASCPFLLCFPSLSKHACFPKLELCVTRMQFTKLKTHLADLKVVILSLKCHLNW